MGWGGVFGKDFDQSGVEGAPQPVRFALEGVTAEHSRLEIIEMDRTEDQLVVEVEAFL